MLVRRGSGGVATEEGWVIRGFLQGFFASLVNPRIFVRCRVLWALETCSSLRCGDLRVVGVVKSQTVRVAFCAGAKEEIWCVSSGDLDWTCRRPRSSSSMGFGAEAGLGALRCCKAKLLFVR